ncbi:hypothetical protein F5148DRAFT_16879 [Russula earlei]|uniref:Uncharacterized protein n=1 Tax=Russula earlei TaxID=71964 RepID=A0ACC0UL59_9AGAM|nr:hypothetical protein F5148DRAFT_16879 [Russula earlei]
MIPRLPQELAEHTLVFCHPRVVAAYAQTCRGAYALVYRSPDLYLWRTLFLDFPFDDPRLSRPPSESSTSGRSRSPPLSEVDWRTKLQRRVRAETIARRDGDRHEFLDVLFECIREAAPRTREPSHNLSWVTSVLTLDESPWIEGFLRLEQPPLSPFPRRLASDIERLRAHLALSLDHGVGAEAHEKLRALRRLSRAHVYDLRNYVSEAHWGPFTRDGDRVNWAHVNAIVTVIAMNLRDFGVHWPKEFKPHAIVQGLEACRPYSAPGTLKRSPLDWAGVEGQWMRIVCFCDYRDLIRFNNSGWDPAFFDDEYQEASRLLLLDLRLISVESDPAVVEKLPDPSRPPITFAGTMRGFNSDAVLHRAVRGTIRVMEDGNIRWSFVSIYNSHDQWSSEGVQIGGVCSAAGVVGAWSGARHDQGDPSGPFWLFKADEAQEAILRGLRRM